MKERRIRIVSKERRVLDIGKYVLAVIGLAEPVVSHEQLALPLPLEDTGAPTTAATKTSERSGARQATTSITACASGRRIIRF